MSMVTNSFHVFLTVFQVLAYIRYTVSGDGSNNTGASSKQANLCDVLEKSRLHFFLPVTREKPARHFRSRNNTSLTRVLCLFFFFLFNALCQIKTKFKTATLLDPSSPKHVIYFLRQESCIRDSNHKRWKGSFTRHHGVLNSSSVTACWGN